MTMKSFEIFQVWDAKYLSGATFQTSEQVVEHIEALSPKLALESYLGKPVNMVGQGRHKGQTKFSPVEGSSVYEVTELTPARLRELKDFWEWRAIMRECC